MCRCFVLEVVRSFVFMDSRFYVVLVVVVVVSQRCFYCVYTFKMYLLCFFSGLKLVFPLMITHDLLVTESFLFLAFNFPISQYFFLILAYISNSIAVCFAHAKQPFSSLSIPSSTNLMLNACELCVLCVNWLLCCSYCVYWDCATNGRVCD